MRYRQTLIWICMLLLTSCQEPMRQLPGTYSYKQSGQAMVGSAMVSLPDEIGTMDIFRRSDSLMLVTINQLGGSVCTAQLIARHDSLYLQPYSRRIDLTYTTQDTIAFTIDTTVLPIVHHDIFDVQLFGEGEWMDGTILLRLSCQGKAHDSDATMEATDILMIAKKNEK